MHDLYLILVHCFVCFVPNLFNQMSRRSLDHTVYCPVQSYLRNICAKSIRIKSNVYRVSQKKRLEGHRLRNSANQPSMLSFFSEKNLSVSQYPMPQCHNAKYALSIAKIFFCVSFPIFGIWFPRTLNYIAMTQLMKLSFCQQQTSSVQAYG